MKKKDMMPVLKKLAFSKKEKKTGEQIFTVIE